ncbi:hypothetical protein BpHYR1_025618 [Brachionus plicatilis]|uniref:Uncharacterized protein n=1 Tax=Brachionus plicatilis TaxID=10195 RepID=A0A3M7SUD7_BRAPC|nr:hypothetical protein BpHYR1_025618 [Brachionus plicatilis]
MGLAAVERRCDLRALSESESSECESSSSSESLLGSSELDTGDDDSLGASDASSSDEYFSLLVRCEDARRFTHSLSDSSESSWFRASSSSAPLRLTDMIWRKVDPGLPRQAEYSAKLEKTSDCLI